MDKALFEMNVEILRQAAGNWMDRRLVIMGAAQFAAKGKKIDGQAFIKVSDSLKKSASFFSPLRSIHFPMAGLIMSSDQMPDEEIARLHRNFDSLRSVGLKNSNFTYIAAFLMEEHMDIGRIKAMHEEMKKFHRFLTTADDYPDATIIAKQEGNVADLIAASEQYYRALNENGFYKGNDLQFLANMLVMSGGFNKELVSDVIFTRDELSRSGLKVKQMHYPSLGVIALSGRIKEAAAYSLDLKDTKIFKWYKDMAITTAAIFVSQEFIDAAPGLTAAIQAMIQAQQASAAAITVTAVATSSSAGS